MKFNLQLFADTSATAANPNLVQKAWARQVWEAGRHQSFFDKFMGTKEIPTDLDKRSIGTLF